jgi:hypothetical protein
VIHSIFFFVPGRRFPPVNAGSLIDEEMNFRNRVLLTRKIGVIRIIREKNLKNGVIDPMKQNITLSIDRELIQFARVLAAQRRTSVSRMLSEELQKLIEDSKNYERAKRQALNYLNMGFHLGGKITVSREELHER